MKLLRSRSFFLLLVLSLLFGSLEIPTKAHAAGTISLTSETAYTENFDSLVITAGPV